MQSQVSHDNLARNLVPWRNIYVGRAIVPADPLSSRSSRLKGGYDATVNF
jgi:hypothetical protein